MGTLEKIDEAILDLIAIENEKKALKEQLAELDAREEEIKEIVLPEMKSKEMKTFENEEIRITFVEKTSRETIDNEKLKRDYPAVANECRKISEIKENWKITLKGAK